MKRLALAVLLTLSPFCALAAPTTQAQIDRLLEVMRARETVAAVLPQVEAQQAQMAQQLTADQTMTTEQRQRMDAMLASASKRTREALSWDKLEPLYRQIYGDTFSAEEMEAMIGFYGSPAGQSVLAKMPTLMQHTMAAMQKLIVPMLEGMQRDMQAASATDAPVAEPAQGDQGA